MDKLVYLNQRLNWFKSSFIQRTNDRLKEINNRLETWKPYLAKLDKKKQKDFKTLERKQATTEQELRDTQEFMNYANQTILNTLMEWAESPYGFYAVMIRDFQKYKIIDESGCIKSPLLSKQQEIVNKYMKTILETTKITPEFN